MRPPPEHLPFRLPAGRRETKSLWKLTLTGFMKITPGYPGSRQQLQFNEGKNAFQIRAHDKAHNDAPPIQGERYYLPGPLSIDIREPSITMRHVADLPPMPSTVRKPRMHVELEIDDGIGTVPETIRYCRLSGNGQTIQLLGTGNYLYSGEVILIRGRNGYRGYGRKRLQICKENGN